MRDYTGIYIDVDDETFHLGNPEQAKEANRALRNISEGEPYRVQCYRKLATPFGEQKAMLPLYASCDYTGCEIDSDGRNVWGDGYPDLTTEEPR